MTKSKMKVGLLVLGILVAGGLTWGTAKVLAQVLNLPRVTVACETKIGGVLMAIDDGFSTLRNCPGNARKVLLGETVGENGSSAPGNVAFIGGSVLMKDGTAWFYLEGTGWVRDTARDLPAGFDVSSIVQWGDDYFLTKSGDMYRYSYGYPWKNVGSPTLQ